MKKLQDNLPARIAASVILTVSFLLTLLSTAGIVLLASYQAYNDGGAQLRTSYLHAAGVQEYYDHVEPVLEGLVHEPQSYQNYLNSLNVHVDVKTTDGTTVFSNAKEGETSLLEAPSAIRSRPEKRSSGRIRSRMRKRPSARWNVSHTRSRTMRSRRRHLNTARPIRRSTKASATRSTKPYPA